MLKVDQVTQCKQWHAMGRPIRGIAKELGISRNTVRAYVRGDRVPGEYLLESGRPCPVSGGILGPVKELLVREQEAATPRKQRLTASRIHQLLAEQGLHASGSTVRAVVRRARLDVRDPLQHAYLPLQYDPGVDAQVDFFEGEVDDVNLGRVKCFILLVRACYSGRIFAYAAPNQTREALFEGLMRGLEFFGGVFLNLWFDNLTPAVQKVLGGRHRKQQRAFECFCAHYGFTPQFCAPGKGNEKGGVEGSVKFSRPQVLSPIQRVDGRGGIQALCDAFMAREVDRTISGHERTIGEEWKDEVAHLLPLPARRFDASVPWVAKVSPRSWVSVGTVSYSVPVEWVGRSVLVKMDAERLRFWNDKGVCIEHARCYRMHQRVLILDHYLPLLQRKHRGIDRAQPVREFLESAPGEWRALLLALRRDEGEIEGAQAFVEVLFLCRTYGVDAVGSAVEEALRYPRVTQGLVRFCLWRRFEAEMPARVDLDYAGPAVEAGSPRDYAVLLSSTEVVHG